MKIGFWQYSKGHGNSTANMLAVASLIATRTSNKCVLMQTHFNNNNMEQAVCRKNKAIGNFIGEPGMDELIRLVSAGKVDRESVISTTRSFLNGKLNIVPSSFRTIEDLYTEDFQNNHKGVLNAFESVYDLTFIDVEGGFKKNSLSTLKECDYIVCSLSQEQCLLDTLFRESRINLNRTIFVIGNYENSLVLNYENIIRLYSKNLNDSNLYALPHCASFSDALNTTRLLKFMHFYTEAGKKTIMFKLGKKNVRNNDIEMFIHSVEKLSTAILELTGLT